MTPTIAIRALSCLSCFSDWKKAWKEASGFNEKQTFVQTLYMHLYSMQKKKKVLQKHKQIQILTVFLHWKMVYCVQPNFQRVIKWKE